MPIRKNSACDLEGKRVIIGIDPGTLVTGYGIIECLHGERSLVVYDIIRNAPLEQMPQRLQKIYDTLLNVIDTYHPCECAIETAYYGKNAQSALKIGHARGVAMLAAAHRGIPTTEYTPREVKQAVTGTGAASKKKVHYMVQALLKLTQVPQHFDETDALALALCHSLRAVAPVTHPKRKPMNWAQYVQAHPEKIIPQL
ncbi:MAG: crossover junction endodeoxyribonuclease RuvC [Bacteroidetes bacterium]|nr:crossover junction endodeoxyribonuclease RuvC [Bacteroidota bacterium]